MGKKMIKRVMAVLAMLVVTLEVCARSESQSVGLVLSGGGAKGIAHIGVIQALEDNDIPIDYVTGTSMGAIVGGLYAAGYTPDEMLELILSRDFSYWSTGQIDPNLVYYFNREQPSPTLISIPIATNDSTATSILPQSVISPLPMNFAFMNLFAPYTAQCGGNFDKLFVPYRCVASNVKAKSKQVLGSGSLGDAIRASMTFPVVFNPIKIDGNVMYDGGIYDNFPVDVMKSTFAPSIMIGVDVAVASSSSSKHAQSTNIVTDLEDLIIQKSDHSLTAEDGIKISIDLHEFGLLDFPKAKEIYRIGYLHAMDMMDSIKARIGRRVPSETVELRRNVFKSKTPYLRFDEVNVEGGDEHQNAYIKYTFKGEGCDTVSAETARYAYYRAISGGRLQNLYPQAIYNDSTDLFTLNLKATVKDNMKVGVGGYVTSSTNSFIFLSGGYSTLGSRIKSAGVSGWLGQSYLAGSVTGLITLRTAVPSAMSIQAVASRQKFYETDYLFYEDKLPNFIASNELFVRANYTMAAGRSAKAEMGVGYGNLYDSYYRSTQSQDWSLGRDKSYFHLGQVRASYEYSTLDNLSFPTFGNYYKLVGMGVLGNYEQKAGSDAYDKDNGDCRWLQMELTTRNYVSLASKWGLGVESDIMLSTRKLLNNYNATIVQAPSYNPTPSTYNAFNPGFRANAFIGAGVVPFWKPNDNLSVRTTFNVFLPMRAIREMGDVSLSERNVEYGKWFSNPKFFGELAMVYTLPFASLSAYCNYMSYPARNWNVGISFGLFVLAPKFLR